MTDNTNEHAGAEDRATQRVSWWIGGNYEDGEATCRRWEAMVTSQYTGELEAIEDGADAADARRTACYQLAEDLKDWTEDELGEDVRTGLVGEFVSYMLACVDWTQLATDALDEEARQQA